MKNFNSIFNQLTAMPKRLAMVLTVLFTVGVGQMWGETLTLNNLGAALSSTSNSTVSTTTITATGDNTNTYTINYLQCKKQTNSSTHAMLLAKGTGAFISNKTAMPGNIKSVTVYVLTGAAGKTTYHCAFSTTECTEAYSTGSTAVNITGGNSNKYTCSVANAKYFCISLGNSNNGQVYKVDVEYEATATYTVTYNANGATSGTVPNDATQYNSGATVTVKTNSGNLARTGYTFGGWNTNSTGTGTNYTAGSGTFKITGNTTLYAKWTAKQTNISINANTSNNGSGSGLAVIATYGQALPSFTACTPATGYELVGYYTSAIGGTKVIGKDGKLVASVSGYTDANAKWINESASLTLYAQYSAKNYTVTYAGNSGTTSCTGGTYTYNSSFAICSDKPTRTGYSFTGWSDGTNTYQPGANYTMPAKNVTFTAQWQINTYKVKWNVDGSETEVDVNYNSKLYSPKRKVRFLQNERCNKISKAANSYHESLLLFF